MWRNEKFRQLTGLETEVEGGRHGPLFWLLLGSRIAMAEHIQRKALVVSQESE